MGVAVAVLAQGLKAVVCAAAEVLGVVAGLEVVLDVDNVDDVEEVVSDIPIVAAIRTPCFC